MPFGIQPIHIVVIVVVALLIFGPKRLPEMGRSIGKAINEFRNGTREMTDSIRQEVNQPVDPQTTNNVVMNNTIRPTPPSSIPLQTGSFAPVATGNFCIQCGSANVPPARFCNQCGTKLPEKAG
jgi:sec-independent protein translocase protein TatA